MSIDTLSNAQRVKLLAAANSDTSRYLSDQNMKKYGTNRLSELRKKIGDNGQPWEQLYNNAIKAL